MANLVSHALTNLSDVKETLGIDSGDSSKDNLITRKINQATEMIEGYCGLSRGHHFTEATYTNEEYDGTGGHYLILHMRPVTSVDKFQYRDAALNEDDWTDVDNQSYFVDHDAGVIDLLFTPGSNFNRFRVTYTAGYDPIPADLSEASVKLAAFLTDNEKQGSGIKSQSEGRRKIEYFQPSEGSSILHQLSLDDVLDRYMMVPLIGDV